MELHIIQIIFSNVKYIFNSNFFNFRNPTPNNSAVHWKPYTIENANFMYIAEDLVLDSLPDNEEIQFWESIYKQYLPQNIAFKN